MKISNLPRIAGSLVAILLVLPAVGQQEPPATEEAPEPPVEQDLPPIPAPPTFNQDVVASIEDIGGDLFWFGQSVNVVGSVMNNAFLAGSTASIDGVVNSDAFAFGSTVFVTGEVRQNLYTMTGQLVVQEGAVVHGNIMCFCGSLTVNGTVRGQILGSGGQTILSGEVGSTKLEVGSLAVMPNAIIHGDLIYDGNDEARIDEGADIRGDIVWDQASDDDADDEDSERSAEEDAGGLSFWDIASTAWWYLANLIVGMAVLAIGGPIARRPVERLRERAAVGLGFGFVVAVVVPVACLIGVLVLVALPLSIITMQLYMIALFVSRLVTAQFLGDWLLRRGRGVAQSSDFKSAIGEVRGTTPTVSTGSISEYLALAVGLIVFFVITEIPYIGFLIWLTGIFFGMGGMFLALRPKPAPAASA